MAANGPTIISTYDREKQKRANFDERWDRMAPFIAPSRLGIISLQAPGESQTRGVYDSTTMMAAELMAHFIAGNVINPGQRWMSFRMRNLDPRVDSDPVDEWLDECRDLTLARAAASSFYAEGAECLIDWAGFGTGCLFIEEAPRAINRIQRGFRGFYFCAQKTGRFVIAEGPGGLIDTLYREYQLSARVINSLWPDGNLPEKVRTALATKPEQEFKIIHAIYPRASAEQASYRATGLPWASCYVEHESKTLIHESGYRKFPAAVPRYHRTPDEVYGRGRGDLAFPDAWSLNTAKRLGLEDHALKIRPPILHGHDSVFGTFRLTPGGPTSVNTHGKDIRQQVMPFETGSRPEITNIKEEELRKSINMIFYVNHILALLEVHKSEMTAEEYIRKTNLIFQLIGPVYARLEWEKLYQEADIMFDIQAAANALPPPPPEAYASDGSIDIEFQNPLARMQRSGDTQALSLSIQDLAPLIQVLGPQVLDELDPDRVVTGVLDTRGVPAAWRRSNEEKARLREERAKQEAQDVEMERVEQAAGAAGKAAPALKAMSEAGMLPAGAPK